MCWCTMKKMQMLQIPTYNTKRIKLCLYNKNKCTMHELRSGSLLLNKFKFAEPLLKKKTSWNQVYNRKTIENNFPGKFLVNCFTNNLSPTNDPSN